MGREIRRVPLDFDWPLGVRWDGFVPPPDGKADCTHCSRFARGYNRLGEAFHQMASGNRPILPERKTALSKSEQRFIQAIHKSTTPKKYRTKDPFIFGYVFCNNRSLVYQTMKHLAQSLKLPMSTFLCEVCKGEGRMVVDKEQRTRHRKWKRRALPKGEGWQVWETVSEGSPVTPVFPTAEELVEHLCTVGTVWDQENAKRYPNEGLRLPTREQAEHFVNGPGWVPSMVMVQKADGTVNTYRGIEASIELQGGAE